MERAFENRARDGISRFLLIVASVLFALIISELALRVLRLAPTDGVFTVSEAEFRRVPGIFAPNRSVVDRSIPALTHQITIDSLGFRGLPVARKKPTNEARILFIGDSFTFGEYINDDQTLPAQVEHHLKERCRTPPRVINAGLRGSTIVDQMQLVERALTLNPDVVVLVFSQNDVDDLRRTPLWNRLAASRTAKSRLPMKIIYPLLRHTALWNLGLRVTALRAARTSTPGAVRAEGAETEELRNRYRSYLLKVRDEVSSHGALLIFAVYPSYSNWTSEAATAHERADGRWAVKMAATEGISVVDLEVGLRASGAPKERLFLVPYDLHPSARAHAIAAEGLARKIVEELQVLRICEYSHSLPQ